MSDTNPRARGRAEARIRDGLRELNRANASDPQGAGGYGELATLLHITKEIAVALGHAEQWLQAANEAGRLTTDSGDPADSPEAAFDALIAAKAKMENAASALDAAAGRALFLAPRRAPTTSAGQTQA